MKLQQFEMEAGLAESSIVQMEPPSKRKRGRPKKVPGPNLDILDQSPNPSPNFSSETNRFAGRISLRPNRRVDVRKGELSPSKIIYFCLGVVLSSI